MDLSNIINETWQKYKLDDRLNDTKDDLDLQIKQLESKYYIFLINSTWCVFLIFNNKAVNVTKYKNN